MKFNIVTKEGEPTSAVAFFGAEQFTATHDHPRWADIVAALRDGTKTDDEIKGLFDVTVPISANFTRLSERVMVNAGRIFFDGVEVDTALSKAIVNFYSDGHNDFMPLVNFMEKIATNPHPKSVEQLFAWLRQHKFGICPDGDFIAYKGIQSNRLSATAGTAIVNGDLIKGQIPNQPDTIIEMPRNQVTFDPRNGCATGLHVGNWGYASTFSSITIRVKVNPRDVVSVPTDSHEQKMRVCRYRVLDVVRAEDRDMLFVDVRERLAVSKAQERRVVRQPSKKEKLTRGKKPKPAPKPLEFPEYYEEFTRKHFEATSMKELRMVAKEFEIAGYSKLSKPELIPLLLKVGRARKRTWPKEG